MDDTTATTGPGRAPRGSARPRPDDPRFALSRPAVAPPVRPVPEWRAEGRLREAYGELRAAMRVPWVGVITQALARWEPFYLEAWARLRPAVESEWFARGCDRIARRAVEGVRDALPAPDLAEAMRAGGYGERELAAIRATLDALNHGNPQYLVYATAVRYALAGAALGDDPPDPARLAARGPQAPARPAGPGVETATAAGAGLVMVEEHHALPDVRAIYGDIKATLGLPFVNSDYKALARWPTLLAPAWASLRPLVDSPAYARLREALHREAVAMAIGLPMPYRLDRAGCAALGMRDEEVDELLDTISLFQWLLSGLVVNVTWFRAALR